MTTGMSSRTFETTVERRSAMGKRMLCVAVLATAVVGVILLAGQFASAGVIYVDFSDNAGSANDLVGGGAATWNVVTNPALHVFGALDDDGGTSVPEVKLKISNAFEGETTAGGDWESGGATVPWSVDEATDDNFHVWAGDNKGVVTLYDLPSDWTFTISVLSSKDSAGGGRDGTFKVNGATTSGSDPFDAYSDGWTDREIMVWTTVTPDVNGEIELELTRTGGDNGYLSAMKIEFTVAEPIAEPAGLGLVGLALLGLKKKRS
jgi:hypothetical protein